jgi:hypothetical protein
VVKKKCQDIIEKAPSALIDICSRVGRTRCSHIQGRQVKVNVKFALEQATKAQRGVVA